jgi:hypothetical protein
MACGLITIKLWVCTSDADRDVHALLYNNISAQCGFCIFNFFNILLKNNLSVCWTFTNW